jgi:hypothetical protein
MGSVAAEVGADTQSALAAQGPALHVLAGLAVEVLQSERAWLQQREAALEAVIALLSPPPGELPSGDPAPTAVEQGLWALLAEFRVRAAVLADAASTVAAARSEIGPADAFTLLV